MKSTRTIIATSFLLITLLLCSSGCVLTRAVLDKGCGQTFEQIDKSQIKKGDKVGIYPDIGLVYVIQYPTNRDNSKLKMPEINPGWSMIYIRKPKIAYYALVVFTIPIDFVLTPIEIFMLPQGS